MRTTQVALWATSVAAILVLAGCDRPAQPVEPLAFVDEDPSAIVLSSCADITSSGTYQLNANLSCTATPAFTISANNVVLHLRGHSITGNYGANGPTITGSNVTIHGPGTVQQYQNGIQVTGAYARVNRVTFVNDLNGGLYFSSTAHDGAALNNTFQAGGYAGFSAAANRTRLRYNTFDGLTVAIIYSPASKGHYIADNIVTSSGQYGLQLDASNSQLFSNSVTGSGAVDIIWNCSESTVKFKSNNMGSIACLP